MVHDPLLPRYSRLAIGALALALAGASLFAQQATAPSRVAVRAAHLIDVVSGKRVDNAVVLIEGDRIVQV